MADDGLSALSDKYREMRRLRAGHRGESAEDPRPAMAALAARFPGALRQLDRLRLSVIEARVSELEAASGDGELAPEWARWEIAYHGRMRATLRVKSAVRGARGDGDALTLAVRAWAQLPDEPDEPMNAECLASIREPPGGRLNPLVVAAVATAHGVTATEVRDALFGQVGCVDD